MTDTCRFTTCCVSAPYPARYSVLSPEASCTCISAMVACVRSALEIIWSEFAKVATRIVMLHAPDQVDCTAVSSDENMLLTTEISCDAAAYLFCSELTRAVSSSIFTPDCDDSELA